MLTVSDKVGREEIKENNMTLMRTQVQRVSGSCFVDSQ